MSAATKDALADKRPQMPEKYTWLRQATSIAERCCVSLCVPTSDIDDARSKLAEGARDDSDIDAVLKRVVAIKIPGEDSTWSDMHFEVRILQEIRRQAHPRSGGEHFIETLDHYDMEAMAQGEPGWLVMVSSSVCSDLQGVFVYDVRDHISKALLWLAITELYEALYFLHRDCKPPITYGDISVEAIFISFQYEEGKNGEGAIAKRPKISLIGFAESEIHDPTGSPDGLGRKNRAEEEDFESLASAIHNLINRCYEDEEWTSEGRGKAITRLQRTFWKDDTPEEVKRFVAVGARDLESLWADIGNFAKEQLDKISDEEWEKLRDSIIEVTEAEGKLRNIVKDLLKGQVAKT